MPVDNLSPMRLRTIFDSKRWPLTATFDFREGQAGEVIQAAELLASDPVLDYAIVKLKPVNGRQPLCLLQDQISVPEGKVVAANVIQHPHGNPMIVALRNNAIYRADYPNLSYFTNTDSGSSGSPVFNDNWRVLALHKRWQTAPAAALNGVATGYVNAGTQIPAILAHLQGHFPTVASVIKQSYRS